MKLIYVAHQFGGNTANLDRAEEWVAWLCANFGALFWAPWVPLCRHWPNSGDSLERGMCLDKIAITHSDGMVLVGGKISVGMDAEVDFATTLRRPVRVIDCHVLVNPKETSESWIRLLADEYGRATP